MTDHSDSERNRLSGRLARYARVGTGMSGVAARVIGSRAFGLDLDRGANAAELARALGGLKGPIMKVAQLLSTIPDAIPPEYAAELSQLQADAPPMGWAFVKRRMSAELGAGWQKRFKSFDHQPAAAASLGQVHRAQAPDGTPLACKLQYPDMASAVEADIGQLNMIFSISTGRLLTMTWQTGRRLLEFKDHDLADRNRLASAMFKAWWHPFSHYAVIHGDPHLGNYTVFEEDGAPGGINLLDYGCVRIFRPAFVQGVVDLYHGLQSDDRDRVVSAYETWGFTRLDNEMIDILNIWARFIYGPLLEDRVRSIADGVSPTEYGRRQAFQVHQALKQKGPVTVPREFVFMDRAAIGLGGVFLHLRAEMNFYRLFNEEIDGFSIDAVARKQAAALKKAGLNAAAN
jgi:predicted unusual protein kinase regulating ubiquinone biosynthesis (AarF/ABC1/UbiB family)